MTDHTPTPWFLAGLIKRDTPAVREHPSLPAEYWEIGESEVDFPPALACVWHEEDARFMLKAVNCHDELLAALEEIIGRDDFRGGGCRWCGRDFEPGQVICTSDDCPGFIARAAIAKAKEI